MRSMLTRMLLFVSALSALTASAIAAPPPSILNHQGRIAVGGANYDGTGYFKFVFINDGGTEVFWSNDGSEVLLGGAPFAAVALPVSKGHYSVGLGDTALANMTAVPSSLFADNTDVFLRTWFSTAPGGPFEPLLPDRRVASSGFAMSAGTAQQAQGVADGAVTGSSIADGSITIEKIAPSPTAAGQGMAFTALAAADSGGSYTSLAVVNGVPAISYVDQTSNEIKYIYASDNEGTSWGTPVTVASTGASASHTNLVVVNGVPAISYFDTGTLQYIYASDAQGTAWELPVTVTVAGGGFGYNSLAVVNGVPAIGYHDNGLKYVYSTDAQGTSWNAPIGVVNNGDDGVFVSLAVVNGRPAISFSGAGTINDELQFARANDAQGNSWSTVVVDPQGGQYSSLAVVDGFPAMSFSFAGANDELKFVSASNAQGTSWHAPVTIDTEGGRHTSLAIVDGRPAISYHDNQAGSLKYAHADDVQGTSWNIVTIDAVGNVGAYSSLALVGGDAAIGYFDETNNDVKFARPRPIAEVLTSAGSGVSWVDLADNNPNNELNTSINLNGTTLEITDAGGTLAQGLGSLRVWSNLVGIPAGFADGTDAVDDADADPTNELQTWVTLPGIPSDFADGTDAVDDADNNPANEIQDLSLSGDTLSISGGGTSANLGQYFLGDGTENFAGTLTAVGGGVRVDNNVAFSAKDSAGTYREMLKKSPDDETQLATATGEDIIFKDGADENARILGSNGLLRLRGDLSLGAGDGLGDDERIYFGATSPSEQLMWDHSDSRFEFTDDLALNGLLHAGGGAISRASVGYHFFANGTPAPTSGDMTNSNDVYVFGDLEVAQTIYGTVSPPSDRHIKEDFEPIDGRAILDKVTALPITTWRYTTAVDEGESQPRHIGPVAQDFHASFGVGGSERHISTIDADGVALAAIQGLNAKVEEENLHLRAENAALRQRLERLEQAVEALAER